MVTRDVKVRPQCVPPRPVTAVRALQAFAAAEAVPAALRAMEAVVDERAHLQRVHCSAAEARFQHAIVTGTGSDGAARDLMTARRCSAQADDFAEWWRAHGRLLLKATGKSARVNALVLRRCARVAATVRRPTPAQLAELAERRKRVADEVMAELATARQRRVRARVARVVVAEAAQRATKRAWAAATASDGADAGGDVPRATIRQCVRDDGAASSACDNSGESLSTLWRMQGTGSPPG